jgi:hypothetical protein
MSKRLLLLAFALTATAASVLAPRAQASLIGGGGPYHSCPMCTSFPDGSQCCINCLCSADGNVMICPENGCASVGGLN